MHPSRRAAFCAAVSVGPLVAAATGANAQTYYGPGTITNSLTITGGHAEDIVVGSTIWRPPSGEFAATVQGGTLTLDPNSSNPSASPEPGPISVKTTNASAFIVTGSGFLSVAASSFGTSIETTGSSAAGIEVTAGQEAASLYNLSIMTSGASSDGIKLDNPKATITGTDVTVTTTGAGASALNFLSNNETVTFTDSSFTSARGPVISLSQHNDTLNLNGSTVTAGADGRWLAVTGSSSTSTINASATTLSGAAETDSGDSSTLTLSNNSLWEVSGNSNVTTLNNNSSAINFAAPTGDPTELASYKTLTVVTYNGAGGAIGLNAFLGADGSPSDRLVINGGSATGNSFLRITNSGGPGALTANNGILVVETLGSGTTQLADFMLAGEVRAGAFDYDLFHGGINGSNPQEWFLRSTFTGGGEGGGGGGGGGEGGGMLPPIPPFPTDPPPNPLPPHVLFPIIGPELATYGVVQPLARQLGLAILGTLNDRVGDTYEPDGCGVVPTAAPAVLLSDLPTRKPGPALAPCPLFSPSVWGRFFGETVNNHYQAFADPRVTGELGGFQGGVDLLRGSLIAGHYERAGLYGAFGGVSSEVNGLVTNPQATAYILSRTGSVDLNAFSAGAYWTHVGPGGWYLDGVLQGTAYGGTASTQFARLDTDGWGFLASLEGGVPFAFPQLGPGFVIEPQGQIVWQKVSFEHRNDGLGDVALGDTTGPSGRIGLRGKWTVVTAGGQVWQPYLRANLWEDWGAEANTVYSGASVVPLLTRATQLELGGGVTARLNANTSLFANVDYEFAVGATNNNRRDSVRGALGVRYTW